MTVSRIVQRLIASLTAIAVAVVIGAAAVEAFTRVAWNDRKGTPGFFLSDPVRRQRLAPGYRGWFAGVPVHINNIGFRDEREFVPEKGPRVFRILVLGDSVTFGHGSLYEHTYPRIVEDQLRAWRPDIQWEVWNAAVPGYNTSQELAQLLEVGPLVNPDLVVVGFFENDVVDNFPVEPPSMFARARSAALSFLYRHVYSVELYKKAILQAAWLVSREKGYRQRLDHLGAERDLIAHVEAIADLAGQGLTQFDRFDTDPPNECAAESQLGPELIPSLERESGYGDWMAAVRRFQQLNRDGAYSVAFFANVVPRDCPATDRFFDGGTSALNDFYMRLFSDGTPAKSVYPAFLRLRPSQMPFAKAHAIGNTNAVKADVLFQFLRDEVLPSRRLPPL